jgi:hypothetical protein
VTLPPTMGVSDVAFFQPIGDRRAIVNGDIVLTADEIQAVIRALRENDIQAFSLHNHSSTNGLGSSTCTTGPRAMEPVSPPAAPAGFRSSARNCPSRDQPLTDAPLRRTIGVTRVRQVVVTLSRDERGERPKSGRL